MGSCCSKTDVAGSDNYQQVRNLEQSLITDEEKEDMRLKRAKAADDRAKSFKQGGGGEKLKMKQKRLEEAEKKNKELGGENKLKWSGDAS